MRQSIVSGLVGAVLAVAAMTVLGASHQDSSKEVLAKLEQIRLATVMGHSKEISAFMKPRMEKAKKDEKAMEKYKALMEAIAIPNDADWGIEILK